MKVYKDHAFIVSDGAGPHGMQIFDLTRLRTMETAAERSATESRGGFYLQQRQQRPRHRHQRRERVRLSGGLERRRHDRGGLHGGHQGSEEPAFAGCFADTETGRQRTGYIHDAQCVNYKRARTSYKGHEICIGSNEIAISIQDVTDKSKPRVISRATYPKAGDAPGLADRGPSPSTWTTRRTKRATWSRRRGRSSSTSSTSRTPGW